MVLFPDLKYEDVSSIKIDVLKEKKIQGIVLDVDNTLIDFRRNMKEAVKDWVKQLKENQMQVCILSNSNKIDKIKKVAETLQIDYFYNAKKPMKTGFKKVLKMTNLLPEQVAVVGDQVFTDVWGANRMKMLSIYVTPISKEEHWYTKIKRPLEKMILSRSDFQSPTKKED